MTSTLDALHALLPRANERLDVLATLSFDRPRVGVDAKAIFGEDHRARRAAVLMPLCVNEWGELSVLLTRRALHMTHHAGEYSFPGGRIEPGEALLDAALREAFEEVALSPKSVLALGHFASVPTMTNYQIEAFVGAFDLSKSALAASEDEVHSIAITPLEALRAEGVHRVRVERYGELDIPIHSFHLDPEQPIWGATAYLVFELLEFLGV